MQFLRSEGGPFFAFPASMRQGGLDIRFFHLILRACGDASQFLLHRRSSKRPECVQHFLNHHTAALLFKAHWNRWNHWNCICREYSPLSSFFMSPTIAPSLDLITPRTREECCVPACHISHCVRYVIRLRRHPGGFSANPPFILVPIPSTFTMLIKCFSHLRLFQSISRSV